MAKYDLSPAALEDLFGIWEYTVENWSEEQADAYYNLLVRGMAAIAEAPHNTGKPYDEILAGLRGYHVGRHMVFFMVQANGRAFISRVLHERMDYSLHFNLD